MRFCQCSVVALLIRCRSTYTKVLVAVDEYLSATLTTNVRANAALCKVAGGIGLLQSDCLLRNLVREQSRGVPPLPHDELSVVLRRLGDGDLDVVVDRGLDRAHEASAHVDALGTESERCSETLAVGEATGGDEGHAEDLAGAGQENEVGDV